MKTNKTARAARRRRNAGRPLLATTGQQERMLSNLALEFGLASTQILTTDAELIQPLVDEILTRLNDIQKIISTGKPNEPIAGDYVRFDEIVAVIESFRQRPLLTLAQADDWLAKLTVQAQRNRSITTESSQT